MQLKQVALAVGLAAVASAQCPQVQIVALGGEGTTVGDLGYLDSTVAAMQGAVPQAKLKQIGYPPGADAPTSLASAIPALRSHIESFSGRCPNSRLFLLGYSVGAAAVANVVCGDAQTGADSLPNDFKDNVLGTVLYGDPTFRLGKAYNRGTCASGEGSNPRQQPGLCFPFGRRERSYCDEGDAECCGGTDPNVHFQYPGLYDGDVASFFQQRFNTWQSRS